MALIWTEFTLASWVLLYIHDDSIVIRHIHLLVWNKTTPPIFYTVVVTAALVFYFLTLGHCWMKLVQTWANPTIWTNETNKSLQTIWHDTGEEQIMVSVDKDAKTTLASEESLLRPSWVNSVGWQLEIDTLSIICQSMWNQKREFVQQVDM